ncbi:MAG: RHS repeat domain-containing protein [Chthoniobacterales bacterium]
MLTDETSLAYTYDDAGQLSSETLQAYASNGPQAVQYTYDLDGNRQTLTYPSGYSVTADYTARNQLRSLTAGTAVPAAYVYDLAGNRTSKQLENGTSVEYGYDFANRIEHIAQRAGTTTFADLNYGYDEVKRRKYVKREDGRGDVYGYDAADQVTGVQYNAQTPDTTSANPDRTQDFDYDPAGNRITSAENSASTSYTRNDLNQYTAVGADQPTYDANGNLTQLNGTAYTYDAQNRLMTATSAQSIDSFTYDARDRCIRRANSVKDSERPYYGEYYVYDGWNLIEEQNTTSNTATRYVHGAEIDELILRRTPTLRTYYHQDALGSTIAISSATGTLLERYSYDVYGKPTFMDGSGNPLASSAKGNRFLFTGREWLANAQLYDYRNRAYSASLGRFGQVDPIRFSARDSNLYRYVFNQPTQLRDSFGLRCVCEGAGKWRWEADGPEPSRVTFGPTPADDCNYIAAHRQWDMQKKCTHCDDEGNPVVDHDCVNKRGGETLEAWAEISPCNSGWAGRGPRR